MLNITLFTLFASLFASVDAPKKLQYINTTYEDEIRTVQLYGRTGNRYDVFNSAVSQLGNMNLRLEFDDLVQDSEDYRVRIVHCNADWTPSQLRDLDYLYDFNEFFIRSYNFSIDTKIKYVHYTFDLPNVKLPGNYLLVAYRGNNTNDILLSQRFMVVQNRIDIELTSSVTGMTSSNFKNQQLDFTLHYPNIELINPIESVTVIIRQNQRWDNAITLKKPSFIREDISELEYRFFNFENNFGGGSEHRFFDLRSIFNPGANIAEMNMSTYPITAQLMTDKPRIYQAYSQNEDINGQFFIDTQDNQIGPQAADYIATRFRLESQQPNLKVFVVGAMNNWSRNQTSKMAYNSNSGVFETELILKQGWYNYQYVVESDSLPLNYLEGNHFETENEYEILVYYKPITARSELLIGYEQVILNPRRN